MSKSSILGYMGLLDTVTVSCMYHEDTLSHIFSLKTPSVLHDAMKHSVMHAAGIFFTAMLVWILCTLVITALPAALFHCVGGCWDLTQTEL
jgi:hypothetical protein